MLNSVLETNRKQIELAFNLIRRAGKNRIGILGLSFKAGSDDLRESPIVTLIETLIGKGHKVATYDEEVALAKLVGANKRYIEETIPHISSLMVASPREVIDDSELLIISKKTAPIQEALLNHRDGKMIIDLVRVIPEAVGQWANYQGISL